MNRVRMRAVKIRRAGHVSGDDVNFFRDAFDRGDEKSRREPGLGAATQKENENQNAGWHTH